ncbi:MAG: M20/M25/M40 family metallo-hydrolase [Armatimonadetes bacterium]|nr:M20/M25/M40 family metallo-hydrolase [Armatimonadota bacterium]MDW8121057.1 M20/M25/M40 family metallo-hydrolase [Armatimonadota bacterium]
MKRFIVPFAILLSVTWAVGALDLASYRAVSTAAITESELREHVDYLASDRLEGRGPGTEGSLATRQYIASLFRDFGLRPLGDGGTFVQEFSFLGRVRLGSKNTLKVTRSDGSSCVLETGSDFLPLALSSTGSVSGPIVFVGYGISAPESNYDDYRGINVKGKVVLALRGTPAEDPSLNPAASFPNKIRAARDKGAVALILVSGPLSRWEDKPAPLWAEPMMAESGLVAVTARRKVAEFLLNIRDAQERIDQTRRPFSFPLEGATAHIEVDLVREMITDGNVIGYIEGSDPLLKKEFVVIGAHFDHLGARTNEEGQLEIYNGADDNASGTSGLLELAQYFAAQPVKPKRSLIFAAFGAEERGLVGSLHFVRNPPIPLSQIVAMVNLDMIGRLRENRLFVLGVNSSPDWPALVKETLSSFDVQDSPGVFGASDHFAFFMQKIPVLFFFTGMHENYHRPSDDPETLNYGGMEKIIRAAARLVTTIANLPRRPQFNPEAKAVERPMPGARVSVGIVPDYTTGDQGVKLLGVRPGSPAEKAGLKAGDIIIQVGAKPVKNIYDFTALLGELEPGKPVDFIVVREGKKVTLSVTPEPVRRRSPEQS